jgi:hypothetical protein
MSKCEDFYPKEPKAKKRGKFHYHIIIIECVLCGGGDSERFRVPGKKPSDRANCYLYKQFAHGSHF